MSLETDMLRGAVTRSQADPVRAPHILPTCAPYGTDPSS